MSEPQNVAYLIDLYTVDKSKTNEKPFHFGYHYLLPKFLENSGGQMELPIACTTKNSPLGMMKIEFSKITPLKDFKSSMQVRYQLSILIL